MNNPKKLSYQEVVNLLQSGAPFPGAFANASYQNTEPCTLESILKLKEKFQAEYGIPPLTDLFANYFPPSHTNCRCSIDNQQLPRTEIRDLGSKLCAKILLSDHTRRMIVPSSEEWIGVNLLERDDELERFKEQP